MIRCTPVCGPLHVRYRVSEWTFRIRTAKETVVGRPGAATAAGVKPARANWRAAPIFGTFTAAPEEDELPQPLRAAAARSGPASQARRLIEAPPRVRE